MGRSVSNAAPLYSKPLTDKGVSSRGSTSGSQGPDAPTANGSSYRGARAVSTGACSLIHDRAQRDPEWSNASCRRRARRTLAQPQ